MKHVSPFIISLLLPLMLSAQQMVRAEYHEGDTLWVNHTMAEVARDKAPLYGIVTQVDQAENLVTIQYYTSQNPVLLNVQHLVASGEAVGKKVGKQISYSATGQIKREDNYVLMRNPSTGFLSDYLESETLYNPDGTVQEKVSLKYSFAGALEKKSYVRTCYYEDGKTEYQETLDDKGLHTVYYDARGKKTKKPAREFEPYMTMPQFPGGQEGLYTYLNHMVSYPLIARENGIQGRALIVFVVAKDGSVEDMEVLRSAGDRSLDREALRVIKAMPKWTPGKVRGRPVRVQYTVPVNFRLTK